MVNWQAQKGKVMETLTKLNPEVKAKWVALLRSGEIQQAQTRLKDMEGKMCCLGVLCELHRRETKKGDWDANEYGIGLERELRCLPRIVREWAGTDQHNPVIPNKYGDIRKPGSHGRYTLAELNDMGYTFAEIADLIEKYL